MSARMSTRRPTIVPSRLAPSSTSWTCARPCVMFTMLSERDSIHRTGRPVRTAAAAQTRYSGYTASLAPKPPPTSGAMTRTRSFARPSHSARSFRMSNGTWVETHTVSRPSSSGTTRIAYASMGTGATRWFSIRARTMTSAPASTSASHSVSNASASVDPASGNRSGAPEARAASDPTTTGIGSYSTWTFSAPAAKESGVFGAEDDAAEDGDGHACPCVRRRPMRRRTNVRTWFKLTGAVAMTAAFAWSPATPALGAPAIRAKLVVGSLNVPTAFTFGPGNRIWYVEKATGEIRIHDLGTGSDSLFDTVPGVNADGERGMLGIALDPGYPTDPYVYVYATRSVSGALEH